jgi:hypothetical protein
VQAKLRQKEEDQEQYVVVRAEVVWRLHLAWRRKAKELRFIVKRRDA